MAAEIQLERYTRNTRQEEEILISGHGQIIFSAINELKKSTN